MRMILTGGGTGGHLYPGLAILQAIQKQTSVETLFIGTQRGIESRVVPQLHIPFKTVWISGLHRGRFISNLLFPLKMVVSLVQALWLISVFCPDLILGTGGFVSWPVLTAGLLLNKITVLQEQNQKPGLVTRLLASHVNRVFLSHDSSLQYFKKSGHCVVCGNPIRGDLQLGSKNEAIQFFNLDAEKKTLFIFGGSQGALGLNRAVQKTLPLLMEGTSLQILWASGPRWKDEVIHESESWKDRIIVAPYIERMDLAFAVADLVLCRSGATTIAELTSLGLPALLIPFPGAAYGHQEDNANAMVEQGAAEMILEHEAWPKQLNQKIISILDNPDKKEKMASQSKKKGKLNAAQEIASDLLEMLQYNNGEAKS
ncbi:undecaprenyldiphospho-muramoylpentapeptide beta-N-acetylglucosaminyltransferase [candidate division KSB1 bacterium]|nr:undecaprenyldiphospho-muramoylpentapeptide beta-N-acetylglucosaminyltransferase [candidate division KSB1 bacterium]